jgi:hypothetical protein
MIPGPGNPRDFNRYSYVRNNPLAYTDPSGNDPCPGGGGGCYLPDRSVVLAPVFSNDWLMSSGVNSAANVAVDRFAVPKRPERGVVRINMFIATQDVPIGPKVGGARLWEYEGDNRDFTPFGTAFDSRAAIELDFRSGEGRVFTNYTCNAKTGTCTDSLPISLSGTSPGTNGFGIEFTADSVSIEWWIVNPIQPMQAWFAADGKVVLGFDKDGRADLLFRRWDGFPSKEAYQFTPGGGYRTVFQAGQGNSLISIPL